MLVDEYGKPLRNSPEEEMHRRVCAQIKEQMESDSELFHQFFSPLYLADGTRYSQPVEVSGRTFRVPFEVKGA